MRLRIKETRKAPPSFSPIGLATTECNNNRKGIIQDGECYVDLLRRFIICTVTVIKSMSMRLMGCVTRMGSMRD
jgi:hypothetical protein